MNLQNVIPVARRTQSGFSMIEVSVAVAVMAIGIVAILGLFANSLGGSRDSAQDTIMALQARTLMSQAQRDFQLGFLGTNMNLTQVSNSWAVMYNAAGNEVTNLSATSPLLTNRAFVHSNRVAMCAVIRTYNLLNNADAVNPYTVDVYTNKFPTFTNTALLSIQMIAPPGASAAGVVTQHFQTLIVEPGTALE